VNAAQRAKNTGDSRDVGGAPASVPVIADYERASSRIEIWAPRPVPLQYHRAEL